MNEEYINFLYESYGDRLSVANIDEFKSFVSNKDLDFNGFANALGVDYDGDQMRRYVNGEDDFDFTSNSQETPKQKPAPQQVEEEESEDPDVFERMFKDVSSKVEGLESPDQLKTYFQDKSFDQTAFLKAAGLEGKYSTADIQDAIGNHYEEDDYWKQLSASNNPAEKEWARLWREYGQNSNHTNFAEFRSKLSSDPDEYFSFVSNNQIEDPVTLQGKLGLEEVAHPKAIRKEQEVASELQGEYPMAAAFMRSLPYMPGFAPVSAYINSSDEPEDRYPEGTVSDLVYTKEMNLSFAKGVQENYLQAEQAAIKNPEDTGARTIADDALVSARNAFQRAGPSNLAYATRNTSQAVFGEFLEKKARAGMIAKDLEELLDPETNTLPNQNASKYAALEKEYQQVQSDLKEINESNPDLQSYVEDVFIPTVEIEKKFRERFPGVIEREQERRNIQAATDKAYAESGYLKAAGVQAAGKTVGAYNRLVSASGGVATMLAEGVDALLGTTLAPRTRNEFERTTSQNLEDRFAYLNPTSTQGGFSEKGLDVEGVDGYVVFSEGIPSQVRQPDGMTRDLTSEELAKVAEAQEAGGEPTSRVSIKRALSSVADVGLDMLVQIAATKGLATGLAKNTTLSAGAASAAVTFGYSSGYEAGLSYQEAIASGNEENAVANATTRGLMVGVIESVGGAEAAFIRKGVSKSIAKDLSREVLDGLAKKAPIKSHRLKGAITGGVKEAVTEVVQEGAGAFIDGLTLGNSEGFSGVDADDYMNAAVPAFFVGATAGGLGSGATSTSDQAKWINQARAALVADPSALDAFLADVDNVKNSIGSAEVEKAMAAGAKAKEHIASVRERLSGVAGMDLTKGDAFLNAAAQVVIDEEAGKTSNAESENVLTALALRMTMGNAVQSELNKAREAAGLEPVDRLDAMASMESIESIDEKVLEAAGGVDAFRVKVAKAQEDAGARIVEENAHLASIKADYDAHVAKGLSPESFPLQPGDMDLSAPNTPEAAPEVDVTPTPEAAPEVDVTPTPEAAPEVDQRTTKQSQLSLFDQLGVSTNPENLASEAKKSGVDVKSDTAKEQKIPKRSTPEQVEARRQEAQNRQGVFTKGPVTKNTPLGDMEVGDRVSVFSESLAREGDLVRQDDGSYVFEYVNAEGKTLKLKGKLGVATPAQTLSELGLTPTLSKTDPQSRVIEIGGKKYATVFPLNESMKLGADGVTPEVTLKDGDGNIVKIKGDQALEVGRVLGANQVPKTAASRNIQEADTAADGSIGVAAFVNIGEGFSQTRDVVGMLEESKAYMEGAFPVGTTASELKAFFETVKRSSMPDSSKMIAYSAIRDRAEKLGHSQVRAEVGTFLSGLGSGAGLNLNIFKQVADDLKSSLLSKTSEADLAVAESISDSEARTEAVAEAKRQVVDTVSRESVVGNKTNGVVAEALGESTMTDAEQEAVVAAIRKKIAEINQNQGDTESRAITPDNLDDADGEGIAFARKGRKKKSGIDESADGDSAPKDYRAIQIRKPNPIWLSKLAKKLPEAKSFFETLGKMWPTLQAAGVNVVIHQNRKSYLESLDEAGVADSSARSTNTDGFFDGKGKVHVVLESGVDPANLLHEVLHPVARKILADNPSAVESMIDEVLADPELRQAYEDSLEDGDSEAIAREEAMVTFLENALSPEVFGDADGFRPESFWEKIVTVVRKALQKAGVSLEAAKAFVPDTSSARAMAESMRDSLRKNQSIYPEVKSIDQSARRKALERLKKSVRLELIKVDPQTLYNRYKAKYDELGITLEDITKVMSSPSVFEINETSGETKKREKTIEDTVIRLIQKAKRDLGRKPRPEVSERQQVLDDIKNRAETQEALEEAKRIAELALAQARKEMADVDSVIDRADILNQIEDYLSEYARQSIGTTRARNLAREALKDFGPDAAKAIYDSIADMSAEGYDSLVTAIEAGLIRRLGLTPEEASLVSGQVAQEIANTSEQRAKRAVDSVTKATKAEQSAILEEISQIESLLESATRRDNGSKEAAEQIVDLQRRLKKARARLIKVDAAIGRHAGIQEKLSQLAREGRLTPVEIKFAVRAMLGSTDIKDSDIEEMMRLSQRVSEARGRVDLNRRLTDFEKFMNRFSEKKGNAAAILEQVTVVAYTNQLSGYSTPFKANVAALISSIYKTLTTALGQAMIGVRASLVKRFGPEKARKIYENDGLRMRAALLANAVSFALNPPGVDVKSAFKEAKDVWRAHTDSPMLFADSAAVQSGESILTRARELRRDKGSRRKFIAERLKNMVSLNPTMEGSEISDRPAEWVDALIDSMPDFLSTNVIVQGAGKAAKQRILPLTDAFLYLAESGTGHSVRLLAVGDFVMTPPLMRYAATFSQFDQVVESNGMVGPIKPTLERIRDRMHVEKREQWYQEGLKLAEKEGIPVIQRPSYANTYAREQQLDSWSEQTYSQSLRYARKALLLNKPDGVVGTALAPFLTKTYTVGENDSTGEIIGKYVATFAKQGLFPFGRVLINATTNGIIEHLWGAVIAYQGSRLMAYNPDAKFNEGVYEGGIIESSGISESANYMDMFQRLSSDPSSALGVAGDIDTRGKVRVKINSAERAELLAKSLLFATVPPLLAALFLKREKNEQTGRFRYVERFKDMGVTGPGGQFWMNQSIETNYKPYAFRVGETDATFVSFRDVPEMVALMAGVGALSDKHRLEKSPELKGIASEGFVSDTYSIYRASTGQLTSAIFSQSYAQSLENVAEVMTILSGSMGDTQSLSDRDRASVSGYKVAALGQILGSLARPYTRNNMVAQSIQFTESSLGVQARNLQQPSFRGAFTRSAFGNTMWSIPFREIEGQPKTDISGNPVVERMYTPWQNAAATAIRETINGEDDESSVLLEAMKDRPGMVAPSTFRWQGFAAKVGDIPEEVSEEFSEIAAREFSVVANDLDVAREVSEAPSVRDADEIVAGYMRKARDVAKTEAMAGYLRRNNVPVPASEQGSWRKLRKYMLDNNIYIERSSSGEYKVSYQGVVIN